MLYRLEKRVMVPLPEAEARGQMIRKHLGDRCVVNFPFEEVADLTEGYSGADIELLCREAAMKPVRRLMIQLKESESACSVPAGPVPFPPGKYKHISSTPVGGKLLVNATTMAASVDIDSLLRTDPVSLEDIMSALQSTRPSSDGIMSKYESWQREYGAV